MIKLRNLDSHFGAHQKFWEIFFLLVGLGAQRQSLVAMRYFGAKNKQGRRVATAVFNLVPTEGVTGYWEPFVGVAGVMVHMRTLLPRGLPAVGSDCNRCIINFLQAVSQGWLPQETLSEELFNKLKDTKDQQTPMHAAVGFGSCYNGLYFADRYRPSMDSIYCDVYRQVKRWAPRVHGIEFVHAAYQEMPPAARARHACVR